MKEEVSSETFFIIPKTVGLIFLVCLCYWVRIQGGIYRLRPCLCSLSERKNLELVAFVIQLVRGLFMGLWHSPLIYSAYNFLSFSYLLPSLAYCRHPSALTSKEMQFRNTQFLKDSSRYCLVSSRVLSTRSAIDLSQGHENRGARALSDTVPFSISQIDIYKEPGSLI